MRIKQWLDALVDRHTLDDPGPAVRQLAALQVNPFTRSADVRDVRDQYHRPVPPQEKVRGRREYQPCLHALDYETGELNCDRLLRDPPYEDCRNWYCPHAPIMRMRLLARLANDAPERRHRSGRRS